MHIFTLPMSLHNSGATLEIFLTRLSRKKTCHHCENRFFSDQAKIRNISSEKRARTYLVIKPTSDFKPKYSELNMKNSTLSLRITVFFRQYSQKNPRILIQIVASMATEKNNCKTFAPNNVIFSHYTINQLYYTKEIRTRIRKKSAIVQLTAVYIYLHVLVPTMGFEPATSHTSIYTL